jgi:hypothetical protein
MAVIQPTKAVLRTCTINSVQYYELVNGDVKNNFHVKELRIYEDICKAYFTGQLVIETMLNTWELFVQPTFPVTITFEAPRSDGGQTKTYTEQFRIYSYDSKPLGGGGDARMQHTIQLIGQEYYNDKHNTVLENFANIPGTAAAAAIHNAYMAVNGGLRILMPSTGLIGSEKKPHEVKNKKPIKAIHDILDRCVYGAYKTCAPVYFRNKPGYVMAPLQMILETGSVLESFKHIPAQGASLQETMFGYNNIIHFRPVAPAGESSGAASAGTIAGLINATSFFDVQTGNYINSFNVAAKVLNLSFMNKIKGLKGKAQQMLQQASRGRYGARMMFSMLDELMQQRQIDKNGPGGYNTSEEAFLTTLNYAPKYWISVPLQTGVNVTCGSRITVTAPIGVSDRPQIMNKVLFVPRLIHEIRFTENGQGNKREPLNINGTTDIYCVQW